MPTKSQRSSRGKEPAPRWSGWFLSPDSPDGHMCPGPGVELWVKEVRCPLGWAPGQVRCSQVCNRLRERPLRCGAWGLLRLQVALYQKPRGWGEAGERVGSAGGQPSTPLSQRRALSCPLWEKQGHTFSPVPPDGCTSWQSTPIPRHPRLELWCPADRLSC